MITKTFQKLMSSKIKNRHRLKSKDIREIQYELEKNFNDKIIDDNSKVEIGDFEDIKLIFIDGNPCFMINESKIFLTLLGLNKFNLKKNYVVVDMGAIKFVTNGADVMSPGIVDADMDIEKNNQVWICDETHHKPLAIGIALISGQEMIDSKKGKAIRTIHYVGDLIWNYVAKSL
jgi:PUA domain protein